MNKAPATAPATDRAEMIRDFYERSERIALQKTQAVEAKVTDMSDIQKKVFQDLVTGKLQNGDGADPAQAISWQPTARPAAKKSPEQTALEQEVIQDIDEAGAQRKQEVAAAANAKAKDFAGTNVIGTQHDGTRVIHLGGQLLTRKSMQQRPKLLESTAKHEAEHRLQEEGDASFSLQPTGNATIDRYRRNIRRLAFRENASMDRQTTQLFNSQEYEERFRKLVEAIRTDLNQRGRNGDEIVNKAARTQEGFRELYQVYIDVLSGNPGKNASRSQDSAPAFSEN